MSSVKRKQPDATSQKAAVAPAGRESKTEDLDGNILGDDIGVVDSDFDESDLDTASGMVLGEGASDSDDSDSDDQVAAGRGAAAAAAGRPTAQAAKPAAGAAKRPQGEASGGKSQKKQKAAAGAGDERKPAAVALSKGASSLLRRLKQAASLAGDADGKSLDVDDDEGDEGADGAGKDGEDGAEGTTCSLRAFFEALAVLPYQSPAVQARLLWQLEQVHTQETGGTGSKSQFSARVTAVPLPSALDDAEAEALAARLLPVPGGPAAHALSKTAALARAHFGALCKHKLTMPANMAPGAPHKLERGSPFLVAVAPSTERVVMLYKELKKLGTPKAQLLKLFSHRTQLVDQMRELRADVRVVVGTPARLAKLVEAKALRLDRCELVLVDCARDVKTMTILTMNQVRDDFAALWMAHLRPLVAGVTASGVGAKAKAFFI